MESCVGVIAWLALKFLDSCPHAVGILCIRYFLYPGISFVVHLFMFDISLQLGESKICGVGLADVVSLLNQLFDIIGGAYYFPEVYRAFNKNH